MADVAKTNAVTNGSVTFAPVAGAASQTIQVSKDERMVIYVNNASASQITATVPKGNGIAGVADLSATVAAGTSKLIGPLESAAFGTNGVITLNLSDPTSVTVGVIQL